MDSFGKLFRAARKANRKTLREIADYTGVSVSNLSDIEHGRRRPPNVDDVSKIETILNVKEGSLIQPAIKERMSGIPYDARKIFSRRPELSSSLLRASALYTEEELNQIIADMISRKEGK